ncbi:MAG: DUF1343 domain-containing protein [Bacteroidales bacterium]|nr:DUF1343 domain-containing protein [Bacteroidales bacterium]MBO7763594.1 DUF1343 domain-containing protein [Bacteroidales bacterium]
MRRIMSFALCAVLMVASCCAPQNEKVQVLTGIDVLEANGFQQLQGKRVGLVTNPTGVNKDLVSTVDVLFNAEGVELVALYGPEHGVRGDVHAGDLVSGNSDPKTGLPVHSLYGKTVKPTPEMLEGLDAIIYDIQDIGCRSFTYISTMGKVMEAAADLDLEVIVLDRPNPLGGEKIEGPIVEEGFFSFVSQFEIPYVYGLTCGELALLLNEEGLIKDKEGNVKKCKLTVVPMEGWSRDMLFEDTNLPWVLPSPHIPQPVSAFFYPATGIVGDLGCYSIGVGYTLPFQMIAVEGVDADKVSERLNGLDLPGVKFRPINVKPFYAVGKGTDMQGVQIYITDVKRAALTDIQFHVMEVIADMYPEKAAFKVASDKRYRSFDIVTGSDYFRKTFSENHKFSDIKERWYEDVDSFRELSKKYYLYN